MVWILPFFFFCFLFLPFGPSNNREAGFERVHILMENAKQLLRTLKATFPSYAFEPTLLQSSCEGEPYDDMEEAQCAWSQIHGLLHGSRDADSVLPQIQLLHFLRISQNVMSSTAGNYDLNRLYLGFLVTSVAALLIFPTTYGLLARTNYPGLFLVFSILGYGGMMFASSYVEEEQQFWYWVFTGWMFYLHIKSSVQQDKPASRVLGNGQRRGSLTPPFAATGTVGLALTYRILRRWNQTGQKFAANPDIARTFFPSHQNTFWALVILTYADTFRHSLFSSPAPAIWRLVSFLVTLAAFIFKLAFVASDSPELLGESFLAPMGHVLGSIPLILQARLVFCGVGLMIMLAVAAKRGISGILNKHQGKSKRCIISLIVVG